MGEINMNRIKIASIVLPIMAVVFLVMGVVKHVNSGNLKAACTETAAGVIVDVDSKQVRQKRGSHTEYRGEVTFVTKGDMKDYTFYTEWTAARINVGTNTVVHYDPDDPSTAYADAVKPDNGTPAFITSGLLLIVGGVMFVIDRVKGR